ncbi:MAG: ABC transporter permease subunit [Bilophila wadsworthia]
MAVSLLGVDIPLMRIVMFVGTVVLMLLLYWFINHTRIGTAIRAVAIDQDTAKLMGTRGQHHLDDLPHGPALGGAAGVMMGLYYGQITMTWGSASASAFTAAIMGGIATSPAHGGASRSACSKPWARPTCPSRGRMP